MLDNARMPSLHDKHVAQAEVEVKIKEDAAKKRRKSKVEKLGNKSKRK